jgi:hypothetical protein
MMSAWGLAVIAIIVGVILASTGTTCGCSCDPGVSFSGRFYKVGAFDSVSTASVGGIIGTVEESGCGGPPEGTTLRTVAGFHPQALLAADVDGRVVIVNGVAEPDVPNDEVFGLDQVIGVELDRYGLPITLDEATSASVIEAIRNAPMLAAPTVGGAPFDGTSWPLVLVRSDGIRPTVEWSEATDVVAGAVRRLQLSREVGDQLREVLRDAGPVPIVDGLALTGGGTMGPLHPAGACDTSRPDFVAETGSTVTLVGDRLPEIESIIVTRVDEPMDESILADYFFVVPDVPTIVEVEIAATSGNYCAVVQVRQPG